MRIIQGLREWWQRQTGEEDTPWDGDSPAFFVSLLVHLGVLVALGLVPVIVENNQITLIVHATPPLEEVVELKLPEKFYFNDHPSVEVGSSSVLGEAAALSLAPVISEVSQVVNHFELEPTALKPTIEINTAVEAATGVHYSQNLAVKGAAGEGTTGAAGAIDRITHEIMLSLEERQTLVVWLLDGTASLAVQRQTICDRFERIHQELGIIEAAGDEAFARREDKPLLSSVIGFGSGMKLMTKKPTDNLAELKQAVLAIDNDDSGVENIFGAVHAAAGLYAEYRYMSANQAEPKRNVMFIVFTDEAGSDPQRAEEAIKLCRRLTMPVYVVGVPAPFGRQETLMKWVDPDPQFDQTPQWGVVEQGPESFRPERIKLSFSGSNEDEEAIDSGFGPFALTRLCYETGGIYFSVHPNRNVRQNVRPNETAAYSSHLKRFFDPDVMRKYRPDYVSLTEYDKRASRNKARGSLVIAAQLPSLGQMESPRLRFVRTDEGAFANALTTAQQAAATLEPRINALFNALQMGEKDRDKETILRWQAGYDLAMGRVLAVKVRTETYNAMLAKAKRELKFKEPKNNTWVLAPSSEISVGSQYEKLAAKATTYLQRVIDEHPDTPWAMLAQRELKDPLSWTWKEDFTDLAPPRVAAADAAAAPAPRNDAAAMLKRPLPKRPPPKL